MFGGKIMFIFVMKNKTNKQLKEKQHKTNNQKKQWNHSKDMKALHSRPLLAPRPLR